MSNIVPHEMSVQSNTSQIAYVNIYDNGLIRGSFNLMWADIPRRRRTWTQMKIRQFFRFYGDTEREYFETNGICDVYALVYLTTAHIPNEYAYGAVDLLKKNPK